MELVVAGKTDIGAVREENQDALGDLTLDGAVFLVVADGMGGYAGGSLAANTAVEALTTHVREHWSKDADPVALLRDAIELANDKVREKSKQEERLADMGTTCVCVLATEKEYYVAHVGDSRAYLFRDGVFSLLTEDHTVIQQLIKQGKVKPLEATYHPSAGILMRCLGQIDGVEPDITGPLELKEGDRILLCSDGLTGMVYEDEIADVLKSDDLDAALAEMIRMAVDAGGFDNITVQVLQAGVFPVQEAAGWNVVVDSPEGLALMAAEGRLPQDMVQAGKLRHTTVLDVVDEQAVRLAEETTQPIGPEEDWDPKREKLWKFAVTAGIVALLAGGIVYLIMK